MTHGGDIYKNKIRLDFSVNVNPLGMPEGIKSALAEAAVKSEAYPDYGSRELKQKLSEVTGAPAEKIVLGNGASELLMAAIHALKPEKLLIPVPSFTGYERYAETSGAEIIYYEMKAEDGFSLTEEFLNQITADTDMLILANPNNPTGRYIEHGILIKILEKCSANNITILLDECFMELSDSPETESLLRIYDKWENLIIIRAFTKSLAMPGIRLGYAICSDNEKINKINMYLPEWNISVPAQIAGIAALKEINEPKDGGGFPEADGQKKKSSFKEINILKDAGALIKQERSFLKGELSALGMQCVDSDANFILFRPCGKKTENAELEVSFGAGLRAVSNGKGPENSQNIDLYSELLKEGILIRECGDYRGLGEGWYRIAVKKRSENEELVHALRRIL